jgi:hypothetical protein
MNKRLIAILALIFLAVGLFAVFTVNDSLLTDDSERLSNSAASIEELAGEFLEAMRNEDGQKVIDLALSREEFDRFVWPELPASRPGTNLTSEFVWGQLNMRSQADMKGTFNRNKGKYFELVEVQFKDGVDEYPSFRVHKDTRLVVKDEAGKKRILNLFGSVMELDGEYKIFSFVL